jgi:branched-subunit amino acid transport protein AzlD
VPSTGYLITAIVLSGVITLALRAIPFSILKPLRKSRFVQKMGIWMPAGILVILAVITLQNVVRDHSSHWWAVPIAAALTVAVHLLFRRRTALSVGAGTACYVALLAVFPA